MLKSSLKVKDLDKKIEVPKFYIDIWEFLTEICN